MNKAQLIEQMAKISKLPKSTCKECLEAFITTVGSALKANQTVVLTRFGTFCVKNRKSRVGVNPVTRLKMDISAKKVAKFKAGKDLKDLVEIE